LDKHIWLPSSRRCDGVIVFIAAFVAQKTKLGVSTIPCGVSSIPALALVSLSWWITLNEKFG
jgi:hypothetical protein